MKFLENPLKILLICCLLLVEPVRAEEKIEGPIECNGDIVEYFKEEKKIVGSGNVIILYKDTELKCDKVTIWTDTKEALAEGNAKIIQGENSYEGDKIRYNLQKHTGKITNFKATFPPWYAKGKEAERVSEEKFIVRKGYLTTCEHERPHWKLSAEKVIIRPKKTVTTYNALSWFDPLAINFNVPSMWIPYYVHPLDDDRPRVTLIPGKDKDWGYYLLTSWRYHLTPGQKGRFRLDYRENKDVAVGMDYIYDSQIIGKGNMTTYYMNERDIKLKHNYHRYTKKRWRDSWGHERDYAWKPSTEEEKGLLRIRHQWEMAPHTLMTAEMVKYKDEEILQDYFFNEYEKDVQPESYLLVTNNIFSSAKDTESGKKYDKTLIGDLSLLIKKRMNRRETVTENLPDAKLNINSQRLFGTNFYYTGNFSAVNLHKVYPRHTDDNPGTIPDPQHNNVYDTFNQLSYAAKLGFLSVTPNVGMHQTYFDRGLDDKELTVDSHIRGAFTAGLDVSTKFYKIFDTYISSFGLDINKLRHVITPTGSYSYLHFPTMKTGSVLGGGGVDRHNTVKVGLENKLQTKRGEDRHEVDLAMLLVENTYDFKHTPGGEWSDFDAKLELRPFDWLIATSNTIIDPHSRYHHRWLKQADSDISINIEDKWSFGLGHRYTAGSNNIVAQATLLNLIPGWRFKIYEDMDILGTRQGGKKKWDLKLQEYVINTDLHCWETELRYRVDRDEGEEIMIIFRLKEFPEIPFEFGRKYHKPKVGSQAY